MGEDDVVADASALALFFFSALSWTRQGLNLVVLVGSAVLAILWTKFPIFGMTFLAAGAACPPGVAVRTGSQWLMAVFTLRTLLALLPVHVSLAHFFRFLFICCGLLDRGAV